MYLSIIIPVYNRQSQLEKLLLSIEESLELHGGFNDIEVIVVDDCSNKKIKIPDVTFPIILHRNQSNSGAPISRLTGLNLSRGNFVHFHDSDDLLSLHWLSSIINFIKQRPDLDILLTAREDRDTHSKSDRVQKYFHKKRDRIDKIKFRLIYRNCMGPLGGVTFSRNILEKVEFKNFSSCQDWQMYIDALKHAKTLVSRPDIKFIFNKIGDDRISHNPRKKILGHLQLAKITGKKSFFGANIRLFYLYTCRQHIYNKGGSIFKLYKKNRRSIFFTFLVISIYWRIT